MQPEFCVLKLQRQESTWVTGFFGTRVCISRKSGLGCKKKVLGFQGKSSIFPTFFGPRIMSKKKVHSGCSTKKSTQVTFFFETQGPIFHKGGEVFP